VQILASALPAARGAREDSRTSITGGERREKGFSQQRLPRFFAFSGYHLLTLRVSLRIRDADDAAIAGDLPPVIHADIEVIAAFEGQFDLAMGAFHEPSESA